MGQQKAYLTSLPERGRAGREHGTTEVRVGAGSIQSMYVFGGWFYDAFTFEYH